MQFILKTLLSALVIALTSELAKRSPWFAALLISLPLTSILALYWLYHDTHDTLQVAALSQNIFWLVLPSLVLFIVLPWLLRNGWTFGPALGVACVSTAIAYSVMVAILQRFGIAA